MLSLLSLLSVSGLPQAVYRDHLHLRCAVGCLCASRRIDGGWWVVYTWWVGVPERAVPCMLVGCVGWLVAGPARAIGTRGTLMARPRTLGPRARPARWTRTTATLRASRGFHAFYDRLEQAPHVEHSVAWRVDTASPTIFFAVTPPVISAPGATARFVVNLPENVSRIHIAELMLRAR